MCTIARRVADQVKQHGIGRHSSWTGTAASDRTIAASDGSAPPGGAGRDAGAGAQEIPDLLVAVVDVLVSARRDADAAGGSSDMP